MHLYSETGYSYLLDILPLNHLYSSLPERQLSPLLQIDRMRLKLISKLGDCGLMLQCLLMLGFFPNAPSYHNPNIPSIYRFHEQEMKWEYDDLVLGGWEDLFYPLVFVTTGVWVRRWLFSTIALLTSCSARTTWHMVLLWAGWEAYHPFLCCGQL